MKSLKLSNYSILIIFYPIDREIFMDFWKTPDVFTSPDVFQVEDAMLEGELLRRKAIEVQNSWGADVGGSLGVSF